MNAEIHGVVFAPVAINTKFSAKSGFDNDISKVALLCGGVFDALSDGKITEEEIEKMLADAEDPEKVEEVKKGNFIVNFINGIIEKTKNKKE